MITVQSYRPGRGFLISAYNSREGFLFYLPEHWSIMAIQRHLSEVCEFML